MYCNQPCNPSGTGYPPKVCALTDSSAVCNMCCRPFIYVFLCSSMWWPGLVIVSFLFTLFHLGKKWFCFGISIMSIDCEEYKWNLNKRTIKWGKKSTENTVKVVAAFCFVSRSSSMDDELYFRESQFLKLLFHGAYSNENFFFLSARGFHRPKLFSPQIHKLWITAPPCPNLHPYEIMI